MKILVPVKRVIDYSVRVRVKADFTDVEMANVKMSMNPFDEIAVEAAVRLKEQGIAQEVIIASIGNRECQETIRFGLALGADRGILLETEQAFQPLNIAKILKQVVLEEQPQLVILGKQAIDDDSNQTGQMLAALLDWPQATFASKIAVKTEQQKIEVVREVDGGLETLLLKLPAVVTTDLRLNKPRYITLPNIMQAKRKPLIIKPLVSMSLNLSSTISQLKVEPPNERKSGIMLNSVAELVDKLKHEAKVI
ncbi:MAG: etfB [Gammaproteobacteria bacterium]|jgi:electron transfer flavoprotein beta subunit|nr:etfB [Gammaproteobacteria bacterium]